MLFIHSSVGVFCPLMSTSIYISCHFHSLCDPKALPTNPCRTCLICSRLMSMCLPCSPARCFDLLWHQNGRPSQEHKNQASNERTVVHAEALEWLAAQKEDGGFPEKSCVAWRYQYIFMTRMTLQQICVVRSSCSNMFKLFYVL